MKIPTHIRKNLTRTWKMPYKWPYILLVGLVVTLFLIFSQEAEVPVEITKSLPQVEVQSFSDLTESVMVEKTGSIEPALHAPLIARTGGRVTRINHTLGDTVNAGTTIVSIDTGAVANPTRTQVGGLNDQLVVLDRVEAATVKASDIGITIAKLNLDAATANRSLTAKQVTTARDSAQVAKKTVEEAREFAQSDELGDLAVESATIAINQAAIAQSLGIRSGNDMLQQARQGLQNAQSAKESALASLANSRQQLITARNVAAATVQLQQVTSPVNGEITKLTVRPGSFVTPGQVIGEINASEGAVVSIDVSAAVHAQLEINQEVNMYALEQEFSGTITSLANQSSFQSGLWQVDIFITDTPKVIHPGELVTVQLPAAPQLSDSIFIPLDSVAIREAGVTMFTTQDGKAVDHVLSVIGFTDQYVEALASFSPDTQVIVSGARSLQAGDQIEIK